MRRRRTVGSVGVSGLITSFSKISGFSPTPQTSPFKEESRAEVITWLKYCGRGICEIKN